MVYLTNDLKLSHTQNVLCYVLSKLLWSTILNHLLYFIGMSKKNKCHC